MIHDKTFAELTAAELYAILRLRAEVFVVEQECPYLDPDGRDAEAGARHVWVEDAASAVVAYARLLDDGGARRIGRVVTAASSRSNGLARRLVQYVLDGGGGPWILDAQSHLVGWYQQLGFAVAGAEFVEDGIPHVPMTLRHT